MPRGSWDDILGRGTGQFVWRYGVLCFGSLFFATNTIVRWLSNNPDQRYDAAVVGSLVVISFVYSLSIGTAAGFAGWYLVRIVARFSAPRKKLEPDVAKGHAVAKK